MLFIYYGAANRTPVQLQLQPEYAGFVTSEDANQIAEGLRREFHQELTLVAIKQACVDLAKQRMGV